MTFQFSSTPERSKWMTVVPIMADQHREKELSLIAKARNIEPEILIQGFKADFCEIIPLYNGGQPVFLLGLGEKHKTVDIIRAFRAFSYRNKDRLAEKIAINFLHLKEVDSLNTLIEAAVNGLYLGKCQNGKYKSEQEQKTDLWSEKAELLFTVPETNYAGAEAAAEKGLQIARTQWSIMELVNAPSNKKTPRDLANWALKSGEEYGYQVKVFDLDQIKKLGLYALLAVNQGSELPPTFIVMEYQPKVATGDLPKVGLVGKGVTFDTGGLSIKPSTNMHYMKSDMGGAAAVFGTMEMAAKLQLPVHLIGIVPATDNCVDGKAVKPSDVIDSYSGKTIEIIDTDAEGRLILSDGIAYMLRHYKPEILIDLATLTGSAVRTLGYHAGALFTNNEELNNSLTQVGEKTGERLWRLPLWDEYKEDIKSDVADVRNYSGRPLAGAIGAAKFLEFFTENHPAWAHMDIAGVAFGDSEFSMQKGATAFGVRLLVEYLAQLSKHPATID